MLSVYDRGLTLSGKKKNLCGYLEHVLDERCQKFVENYMKLKIIDLNSMMESLTIIPRPEKDFEEVWCSI
jgi:hypothetical protein